MGHLTGEMNFLQSQAVARSSRRTYRHGQESYLSFCTSFNLIPYPLCEPTLRLFATFLARNLSYASICTYISALRLQNIELGYRPPADMPLLHLLLKGIKRMKGSRAKPKRKPITLVLLSSLQHELQLSSFVTNDKLMLWASFTTAFFGFLRASEFCSPSQSFYDPRSTLLVRDVSVLPDVAILQLKVSKTDQFRNGCEVRLAKSGNPICPYRALTDHLRHCAIADQPLFQFSYGAYLTRQIFSDLVKSLLPNSCDSAAYSSHSFRIGAATCAADKQTPAWLIKALGRWSSRRFEEYIRIPYTTIDRIPSLLS